VLGLHPFLLALTFDLSLANASCKVKTHVLHIFAYLMAYGTFRSVYLLCDIEFSISLVNPHFLLVGLAVLIDTFSLKIETTSNHPPLWSLLAELDDYRFIHAIELDGRETSTS